MAGERHGRGMGMACYVWIGLYSPLSPNLWRMKFKLLNFPVRNPKDKHEKSSFVTYEIFSSWTFIDPVVYVTAFGNIYITIAFSKHDMQHCVVKTNSQYRLKFASFSLLFVSHLLIPFSPHDQSSCSSQYGEL